MDLAQEPAKYQEAGINKHQHAEVRKFNTITLKSANLVNHDKILNWCGYQIYYPPDNKYITSNFNAFSILSLGRYFYTFTIIGL